MRSMQILPSFSIPNEFMESKYYVASSTAADRERNGPYFYLFSIIQRRWKEWNGGHSRESLEEG